jgi:hypothetical protein
LIKFGGGVGYLSDGVVLQLYGVFGADNTLERTQLLFQRVGVDGSDLSDVMLNLIPILT